MAETSAVDGRTREEGRVPGSSMHESESQLDNVSEDSFGSNFGDHATPDEEDLATSTDVDSDVGPDSPPPVYPDNEYPQTTFTNMDLKSSPPPVVLQYTPTTSTEPTLNANSSSPSSPLIRMCVVCKLAPAYSKSGVSYPTCGLTCASKMQNVIMTSPNRTLPELQSPPQYTSIAPSSASQSEFSYSAKQGSVNGSRHHRPRQVDNPCVVCRRKPCRDAGYVTCGMKCAEKLCSRGNSNPHMCDYCHRRPKADGYNQCGKTCGENANRACLLCRCRPRFGRYHLCGRTCKKIASKWTPLILEAPPGHATYNEVEKRFKRAWNGGGGPCPPIKKIYKIIENKSFLASYDRYKKTIGNEVFRYHGAKRGCTLGSQGNMRLCSSTACALCSILRTSFNVNLASPSGAFGPGVYTSSAANKAYSYTDGGTGAIILTKVVLGTAYTVRGWNQVMACPAGYNSVVFDRQNGALNETIVYTNDAVRPVFLIIFQ
ncbi:hypothetical protein BYT27DRAFT_7197347 [Phlegmacium glaucopus]|nr:hypothetical protein BYT27DRAFT_7197347 [Phlegmacium glaucopus]